MLRHTLMAAVTVLWAGALALAGGIPLITPGTEAPDGNGWVEKAVAHAQLPDGRLIVGLTFAGAVSPTTGQALPSNYGIYNYDIESGNIVRELRHDYPSEQGGTPNYVGHWCEDLRWVPLILDNGDRMYCGVPRPTSTLYRYVDGQGLIYHGAHSYHWLLNMRAGVNGHLSAKYTDLSAGDRHLALTRGGTHILMSRGQYIPGGLQVQFVGHTSTCGQDGWYTYGVSCYGGSEDLIQSKIGQPAHLLRNPRNNASLAGYNRLFNGDLGIALVGEDVLVQDRPTQPLTVALAMGQSIRGDHRVSGGRPPSTMGGGPTITGFLEGGFLTELLVDDSRTAQELGRGVCLFNADGTLRGAVIPGDPNPFGPGTVQTVSQVRTEYRNPTYQYPNEPRIAFAVHIDDGGATQRAWWRMDEDANVEQAFAQGQPIPGTAEVVTGAEFKRFSRDGRFIYRAVADGDTDWMACYTPGVGVSFDIKTEGTYTEMFVGPNGERVYDVDSQYHIDTKGCWLVTDDEALLMAYPGMPVRDGQYEVDGIGVWGFTAGGRPVLRLDLEHTDSPYHRIAVNCLYDESGLIELVDESQPFRGKELHEYSAVTFDDDYPDWIYTAPGDLPVASIRFADGTSGLYAVPEPATLGLVALGAVAVMRRKR